MVEMFKEFSICRDITTQKIKTLCQAPQKRANLHCCVWFDYLSMLLPTLKKYWLLSRPRISNTYHFSWLPHLSPFSDAKY